MSTAIQAEYDLPALLEQSGAHPRGNRHDCPRCGGRRTLTHTDEVFYCHKCQWKGNTATLAKELGVYRPLPSTEYREVQQKRERADRAARTLYQHLTARRFELLEDLRGLGKLELSAHRAGADHPAAWSALALVYRERPTLLAQLAVLENWGAAHLVRFFAAGAEECADQIGHVLLAGGVTNWEGRFVNIDY